MKLGPGHFFGQVTQAWNGSEFGLCLTHYGPYETQPLHTHEHPTFYLQLRGEHLDHLPDRTLPQPCMSLIYHPAETPHKSEVGPNGMAGLNIELKPAWFDRFHIDAKILGDERLIGGSDVALRILRLAVGRDPLAARLDFESLIFEHLIWRPTPETTRSGRPRWLEAAKDRVEKAEGLSGVADLAKDLAIHPGHLAKAFRRSYGTTVAAAIQAARLARASKLIMQGMSAGEAALEAGFSDQFYMSRCLLRRSGVRPRELAALRRRLTAEA